MLGILSAHVPSCSLQYDAQRTFLVEPFGGGAPPPDPAPGRSVGVGALDMLTTFLLEEWLCETEGTGWLPVTEVLQNLM